MQNKRDGESEMLTELTNETLGERIERALRRTVGGKHSGYKVIANKARVDERTAANWFRGRPPQLLHAIRLMGECPAVFDTIIELAGRDRDGLTEGERQKLDQIRKILSE